MKMIKTAIDKKVNKKGAAHTCNTFFRPNNIIS